MAIKTFGKEIVLKVYSEEGRSDNSIVLDATGLRVDFDINNTEGYNRGTFKIYNLRPDVIKELSNGNRYASLSAGLHGSKLESLGEDFYVSNATTEIILPNTITTLYCMSGKRKSFLEQQITANLKKSSLKEFIQVLVDQTKGSKLNTEFVLFPDNVLSYRQVGDKTTRFDGSVESILRRLTRMYHFQYYLQEDTLRLVFRADTPEAYKGSLKERVGKEFKVDVTNLRANPVVGIATMNLDINLTPSIKPGDVFDTDNFITATNDAGIEYLTAVTNDIKSTVTKYSKFQVWNVIQRGSNYTNQWNTIIEAYTASEGNHLSANQFNMYGRT